MKKFILVLLLIGFLVVPTNIALGGIEFEVGGMTVTFDACEKIEDRLICNLAREANFNCDWVGDRCVTVDEGVPGAGLLEHPEGLIICPIETIRIIANLLFGILALVAVIFIILGAFALMTAQGDATKIETGRTQILYALIAVIVAAVSWGAVTWILEQIGAT